MKAKIGQFEPKNKLNLETVYSNPKKCNKCKEELDNVSALMMGPAWKCINLKCNNSWTEEMQRFT